MTRFAKHLGKGTVWEVEGEQYILKPLGTEFLPDIMELTKVFGSVNTNDMKGLSEEEKGIKVFTGMTHDTHKILQRLIEATLKKSFSDDWKENEEEVKAMGLKYMIDLMTKILEVNSPSTGDNRREELLKSMQDDRNQGKDNGSNK